MGEDGRNGGQRLPSCLFPHRRLEIGSDMSDEAYMERAMELARQAEASAQAKSLTVLHESSFIKTYDEYFQRCWPRPMRRKPGSRLLTN